MRFWGVEVKPDKPYVHQYGDESRRLHVSQATIVPGSSCERTVLQCSVGNKKPICLCSLLPEKLDTCALYLDFEEEAEVTFSVLGPNSVHLSGFFYGGNVGQVNPCFDEHGSDIYRDDVTVTDSKGEGDSQALNNGDKLVNEDDTDENENSNHQIVVPIMESEDEDGFPLSLVTHTLSSRSNREKKDNGTVAGKDQKKQGKDNASEKNKKKKKVSEKKENAEEIGIGEPPFATNDVKQTPDTNAKDQKKEEKYTASGKNLKRKIDAVSHDEEPSRLNIQNMSVVSGEGPPLVACSSAQGKKKKHVIIFYPEHGIEIERGMRGVLGCVPVESLIHPPKTLPSEVDIPYCTKFELVLPYPEDANLNLGMRCICTTTTSGGKKRSRRGPGLYFFGGMDPPPTCDWALLKAYVMKNVYRYDLHKLPQKEVGSCKRHKDMIAGMSKPLLAQVGKDCIYVLGNGKTTLDYNNALLKPAFQEYNFKEGKWTFFDDHHIVDVINKSDCDNHVRNSLGDVPHVVIGRKLHVSLGNSSFAFDTENHVWEDSNLFETFWSKEETKKSGLSPSKFYGYHVWHGAVEEKKRKREEFGGGGCPPFGFYGKGVLWDKNILLGVHCAPECPLVAFLLDDETGRVLKSQSICLNNLIPGNPIYLGAGSLLVDLGRNGYFGLVHFVPGYDYDGDPMLDIELVTFKVSRRRSPPRQEIEAARDDDDHFLVCQFVGRGFVAKDLPDTIHRCCNVFCV